MVPPVGIEPTSQAPQACVLSIGLWGHNPSQIPLRGNSPRGELFDGVN